MKALRKRLVIISYSLITLIGLEIILPNAALALTGGPSQPEVQSFEPIGVSDMVDIFSGDFKYNIPLVEVDGYPVNMSYSGGINVDQEASWVGLGWNLNVGNVDRSMRGVPDDFKGDEIVKEINIKNDFTVGLTLGASAEIFGKRISKSKNLSRSTKKSLLKNLPALSGEVGLVFNSYNGPSLEFGGGLNLNGLLQKVAPGVQAGVNFNYSGRNGVTISPSASANFSSTVQQGESQSAGIGGNISTSMNSRTGVKAVNYGWQTTINTEKGRGKKKASRSDRYQGGSGSLIKYGSQSYTPSISNPMRTLALNFDVSFGKEYKGFAKNFNGSGYFTTTRLKTNHITKNAFGYLNLEHANNGDMMDFNREKDMPFSKNSKNLPIPVNSHDIFSVNAQGLGGSFRVFRNDIVNFREEENNSKSNNFSASAEIAALDKFKAGFNFAFTNTKSESGNWEIGNDLQKIVKTVHKGELPNKPEFEPAYFRQMGELVQTNVDFNSTLHGVLPVKAFINYESISRNYSISGSKNNYTGYKLTKKAEPIATDNVQQTRQFRNMVMVGLTAKQAYEYKFNSLSLISYGINKLPSNGKLTPKQSMGRSIDGRQDHHLSEIQVINTDGTRFSFGINAYNNYQKDVTFALGNGQGPAGFCNNGLADYNPSDLGINNNKGKDNFYQAINTPAYAYSFLLTEILSPDYVDLTNNGISDDDLGSATKFNYTRANKDYRWRVPIGTNKANFIEGNKSDFNDDKGSVTFGSKELWYVHSIEGKNHIAMFYISPRDDAKGVKNIHGEIDGDNNQYKLDSIILYNKQDFLKNGLNAYKVKGVHFQYTYSLCLGTPNSFGNSFSNDNDPNNPTLYSGGKLTLKRLFFTYGYSQKGKFSPYNFEYNRENDPTIGYHLKAHDRWGTFQVPGAGNCNDLNTLNNMEFPYTSQDKATADQNAGIWSLSHIILPSGGRIHVEYEADDYGYVQDKKAMRMYKIHGFGQTNYSVDATDLLYTKKGNKINNILFFNAGSPLNQEEMDGIASGIGDVQVTVLADINSKGAYEYVKSYSKVIGYGISPDNASIGYLILDFERIDGNFSDRNVNPITMNIWNWSRINANEILFDRSIGQNPDVKVGFKLISDALAVFPEMVSMVLGMYSYFRQKGFGQKVAVNKSWVRLNARNELKIGGGHRVKSIKINDHWAVMGAQNSNGANDSEYGQVYEYTTKVKLNDGKIVERSNGVAAYEPGIGGDENPFHVPTYINEDFRAVPDLMYMNDEPIGESFMPSPSVGYSKVTVKSLPKEGVVRTATGKQVYEFYTAKDFPSKVRATDLDLKIIEANHSLGILRVDVKQESSATAGQGFLIELNDMHGKPKAEYAFAEGSDNPISGVKHSYRTVSNNPKELNNNVKVINTDGTISEKTLGVEVEMFNDFRRSETEVLNTTTSVNTDFFTVAAFPLLIPSFFPKISKSSNRIKTVSTVKVVNRYGIKKETIAIKEGSNIRTEDLLYDQKSGQVLVTSVQNEFDDNSYNITYPAHWAYDKGMGASYRTIGISFSNVQLQRDSILLPSGLIPRDYFVPGDLVLVRPTNNFPVLGTVYDGKLNKLNIINYFDGKPIFGNPAGYSIEIIRPGRRNMHTQPIQTITTKRNPIGSSALVIDSIISASAVEFSDVWPFYCDKNVVTDCDTVFNYNTNTLKNYFNLVADLFEIQPGQNKYNRNCLLDRIYDLGFDYDEKIYKKVIQEGITTYVIIEPEDCISCQDSIFVKSDVNRYKGFSHNQLNNCLETVCCNEINNIKSLIPSHAIYDSIYLKFLKNQCVNDNLELKPYVKTCSPNLNSSGNRVVKFGFEVCGSSCEFDLEIPKNFCYDKILEFNSLEVLNEITYLATVVFQMPDNSTDTLQLKIKSSCALTYEVICNNVCEVPTSETIINPYRFGILGNWRLKRNHAYVNNRNYNNNPRPRTDGTFAGFSPYWTYNNTAKSYIKNAMASVNWVWASEITKYTPHGNEIENKDALGRYSAAVFGFNYTLPIAVAGNSKYEQIAYESFEENSYFWNKANCWEDHFKINSLDTNIAKITDEYSHTGNYSLRVNAEQNLSVSVPIARCLEQQAVNLFDTVQTKWPSCLCVGKFNPDTGKYVISAWVKQGTSLGDTSYLNTKIKVKLYNNTTLVNTINFIPSGSIIEGWQRIYGFFQIPLNVNRVDFELVSESSNDVWFDDFRIHPFDANMKTYAYDQITLRLLGELDENNYASFYEYDEEGALIRVKKETIRGVKTIQEVRKQIIK